jgi:16S rRNA (uracil1498-N3)-methyltransferase
MKRTPRVLLPELPAGGGPAPLDEAAAHHVLRVLRLEPGQALEALDGRGGRAGAVLAEGGRRARLDCSPPRSEPEPAPRLEAWLPLIRPERMEWAVEKLTELGVATITVYHSERTGDQRRGPGLERLGRVAEAALLQSGNAWRPRLEGPLGLAELLGRPQSALVIAQRGGPDWRALEEPPPALALLAGPEGGFSPAEMQVLEERRGLLVGLGPHVLRAESALVLLAGLARTLAGHS